ncbi:MAG TPA: ubiquinol-cytochrome C chaperone family protein [Allosphingosinicella sp.]
MSFLSRLFGDRAERQTLRPLYDAAVRLGRDPAWYREAGVPDTMTGRFDAVSSVVALVLLRLEGEGDAARRETVLLTELFIDDMDATLRQAGTGDLIVGKRVGKLMSALGGRLGAYREALTGEGDLHAAVRRNMFRESPPSDEAVPVAAERLRALHARLAGVSREQLLAGEL